MWKLDQSGQGRGKDMEEGPQHSLVTDERKLCHREVPASVLSPNAYSLLS